MLNDIAMKESTSSLYTLCKQHANKKSAEVSSMHNHDLHTILSLILSLIVRLHSGCASYEK